VGENDKLYGSVTPAHIADALAEAGVEIDRRRILLDAPIRNLGEYDVRVRLHADVEAVIALKVVAEGRTEEADAEESAAEEPAVEEAAE
jgi:large subunit ribosomal protein L9